MERARRVDDERRSDAVAQGRRQGYRSDRLPFPAAPQPARRLTAQGAGPREERERLRKWSVVSRRQRRTVIDPERLVDPSRKDGPLLPRSGYLPWSSRSLAAPI